MKIGENMKLIVGLGNPGREYVGTRHNMGFVMIDEIAKSLHTEIKEEKFGGLYTKVNVDGENIILLKPQKYINLSGEVVRKYIDYFKIDVEDILIISDDLDMQVGKIKLKLSGSSGGHNGLKNIELHLKTQNYKRIKIGISNNKNMDTKDYVLGKLSKEEKEEIEKIKNLMPNIFKDYLHTSFDNVMNKYNRK